jgi:hypothetical protein
MASPRKPRAKSKKESASAPPPADMAPPGDVAQETSTAASSDGSIESYVESDIVRASDMAAPSDIGAPEITSAPSGIDTPSDAAAPILMSGASDTIESLDRGGDGASRIPTHQEIEIRAYFLSRARPDADAVTVWLLAERQLREEYATRERVEPRSLGDAARPLDEPPTDRRA